VVKEKIIKRRLIEKRKPQEKKQNLFVKENH
jgi:hypothetical protein